MSGDLPAKVFVKLQPKGESKKNHAYKNKFTTPRHCKCCHGPADGRLCHAARCRPGNHGTHHSAIHHSRTHDSTRNHRTRSASSASGQHCHDRHEHNYID
jgi:hypothetical protein